MDVELTESQKDEKAHEDAAFLSEMRERADDAQSAWDPIYTAAREDALMIAGKQWPREVLDQRKNRVTLTINQYPKYIRQVTSDAKQNRINIKLRPVEYNRSERVRNLAGTRDYSLAEMMEGIVRNIEYNSTAGHHYDRSLEQCVKGGIGWLRVLKRYATPDGFEQELYITSVRSPYSVTVDPRALLSSEPGLSGGDYFFVHEWIGRKQAERLYPGEVISDTTLGDGANPTQLSFWTSDKNVRVSEYWWREPERVKYLLLTNGRVMREDELLQLLQAGAQLPEGISVHAERIGMKHCVKWCLTNGARILDGPHEWDGGLLPLAAVMGPEHYLDTEGVQIDSLVRHSHDAQRSFNYWQTSATERVALSPKAKWLAEAQAIAGFEADYRDDSETAKNYLRWRFREGVPKPELVQGSTTAAAEITMALSQNDNIKSTMGIFDASLGQRSNETSGRAILARQREGDAATYDWHDGLAKGVEHIGRILVDLIPKVYDTQRIMRIRLPDDAGEDFVQINTAVQAEDGAEVIEADVGATRFDVAVDVGPALSTRRQEAADSMTAFVQAVPQAGQVMADIVAESMDWPGADRAMKRLRSLVPPQLLTEEERESIGANQPQQPPEPSPEDQVAMKELEARVAEAEAKIAEAQAAIANAQAMNPEQVKELVAEAFAAVLAQSVDQR